MQSGALQPKSLIPQSWYPKLLVSLWLIHHKSQAIIEPGCEKTDEIDICLHFCEVLTLKSVAFQQQKDH